MPDKNKVLISAPKDRSLESFKAWIKEIFSHITDGGNDTPEPTEEIWVKKHKAFWDKVDQAKS